MDIDDNDAQDQNLRIAGEGNSKVSPVLHSYALPKFEFDDSLQGHLRFDNLVDNEAFLEITSQEDNHWIEEYSTAVKSTRKNVWSEATSSESVEMLLKSVGQEEKIIKENNKHNILTSTMDPKGELESVVLGDKYNPSVGDERTDKICDDVNQEASKTTTGSFVNELQEDSSASKVECGNTDSTQNVENVSGISKNGCNNDPVHIIRSKETKMDNSTNSDTIVETRTFNVEKLSVVLNVESVDKPLVEGGVPVDEETESGVGSIVQYATSGTSMASSGNNQFEISEGTEINNVAKALPRACSSAEIPAEDILIKDEAAGNMNIDVVGAAYSPKNVEGVVAIAQAESNMNVLTDAGELVESSKISSPDTPAVRSPRSPILGVSLLSDDNKEKIKVESTSEGTSQKLAPEVEKDTDFDGDEMVVRLNVGRSEQTGEDDSGSLLDPKESKKGEDAAKPLNLAVNMSNQPQTSVDAAGPTVNATLSSSGTKEETNPTFEVNASTSQNLNLSKTMVSSGTTHNSQLDPIKLREDSLVSQSPSSTATKAGAKRNSERKPRKKSVGTETTVQSSNLKEKTPTRRSRKVEKSPSLLTSPVTGHVTPVSSPKPADMTPVSTSNLPILNNSTSVFHHSFTDNQQVQLRAQILVYGSVLSGVPPEEPHMIAAFGHSDGGRKAWEATWHAYLERVCGHNARPNNPGSSTPNQGIKIGSAQSKALPSISSVNPVIPMSSPIWNITTPSGGSQSNAMPKSNLFDPIQTPGVHNFAGHNPMWLSQGLFPGQWVASSPVASFNARFSALPITESIKLTTVKESGAPSMPVIPVGPSSCPSVSPLVSSGQTSSDPKSRKRKKGVSNQFTTSAALLTPVPISSKSNPGNFVSTVSPASTHGQPSRIDQNIEKIVAKDIVSKIEESKVQAADAAAHAAAAVNHCQNVWSQLESQKNSGLVSDDEAKLASSAVSIAAASSVAKVAAAAAKIASNVAEQARLMADEVLLSHGTESYDKSSATSIISAAKEAARRRIEAASAASKHAENLDAIVKAAELAAEAVSQAGKIVAIGNPLSLRELIEAGPEGYWKSPQSSSQQVHSDKQTIKTALNGKEDSGNLVKNQMINAGNEKDKSTARGHNGSNLSNVVVTISKSESGSVHTSHVDQNMPQSTSGTQNDNIIKEGCLVEVRKDGDKKNAWFAANVSTLKDGKALVCYTELLSDDESGKYQEWVPLEAKGTEPPRIRIAHPMTTMRSEGARKRGRATLTDNTWCSGDQVDVWVQDCWCEAVVVETNKTDLTSLVVQFPAQGETSAVRSWHVRPSLIWKDGKWIEWSSLKGYHSSEGDTPHEKRHKAGSPVVEGITTKVKLSNHANIVESGRPQESKNIPLSSQGTSCNLGQSGSNENKFETLKTIKSGLQKKQSRVVFGVPKPGKKQKFINMSTHDVDDRNNKNIMQSDSVNLVIDLMPQISGIDGSDNNSKTDVKEKQVVEVKPKVIKSRKPPIPSVKMLTQKDKSKPSKPTSHDTSAVILSGQPNKVDANSSNIEDAEENAVADRKAAKIEVKDRSTSETEPRRSVRRIQPTSRLLEGLQSSLTVSHASQRNHNKVASKGSTNPS